MGSGEGIMTRQTKNIEQYEVNHYYKKLTTCVVPEDGRWEPK
jgi:hypothetical protein